MPDLFARETADLAEDARQLLLELDHEVPGASTITGECRPSLDVIETPTSVELVIDLPGVLPESVRVAVRRNTLLVVGAKPSPAADPRARFHLAERSYGRFARAVRIGGAFDARRAKAVAESGQVRVILPRLAERRGQVVRIAVERA